MNIFKLKLETFRHKHIRSKHNIVKKVIEKGVKGTIIEDSSTGVSILKVKLNDKYYTIHPDSYNTYNKRRIYRKVQNDWIEYDRPCTEDRKKMPNFWYPFRPKYVAIGNIVQEDENVYFKVRICYNEINIEAKIEAMRIIRDEDLIENCDATNSSDESTDR